LGTHAARVTTHHKTLDKGVNTTAKAIRRIVTVINTNKRTF